MTTQFNKALSESSRGGMVKVDELDEWELAVQESYRNREVMLIQDVNFCTLYTKRQKKILVVLFR